MSEHSDHSVPVNSMLSSACRSHDVGMSRQNVPAHAHFVSLVTCPTLFLVHWLKIGWTLPANMSSQRITHGATTLQKMLGVVLLVSFGWCGTNQLLRRRSCVSEIDTLLCQRLSRCLALCPQVPSIEPVAALSNIQNRFLSVKSTPLPLQMP